jgi:hypothetical protein
VGERDRYLPVELGEVLSKTSGISIFKHGPSLPLTFINPTTAREKIYLIKRDRRIIEGDQPEFSIKVLKG